MREVGQMEEKENELLFPSPLSQKPPIPKNKIIPNQAIKKKKKKKREERDKPRSNPQPQPSRPTSHERCFPVKGEDGREEV